MLLFAGKFARRPEASLHSSAGRKVGVLIYFEVERKGIEREVRMLACVNGKCVL